MVDIFKNLQFCKGGEAMNVVYWYLISPSCAHLCDPGGTSRGELVDSILC